jgi:hypothetical protein
MSASSRLRHGSQFEIVFAEILFTRTGSTVMTISRLAFLSHFVICLACTGSGFFAWVNGIPQTIWANDMSMMTTVIGALFMGTAGCLGWQAWKVGDQRSETADGLNTDRPLPSSDFGHLSERLCVMAGFVGTAIGLSLQAKSLAGGASSFTALATSLFTTASGGTAAGLIAIMTFNLEAGIRRARL